ncbi:MFS transporter [Arthrobacter roseus]|uniref:MFS transporter n=1 Tax=Arthrobacter roseus TaxID=136274 RepID=UPI001963E312|nr:MFS transporter [Arthrobacter roseus]MBM7848862.1 MFS family permease [Arthrobacter roseus]
MTPRLPLGRARTAADSQEPARTVRIATPREIKVLIAAAFVIAIGFGLVAPVLPQFAQSFDVGTTAASIIISAFAFARLVFAPVSGKLVGKLGEPSVYVTGLLIVAVSTGACAFAQNYWQLLIFRGLGGIGSTMFTVSAMGLIIRLAPPAIRGRISGTYATAFLLGNIGGPLIGGLLAGFGLRVPFIVYAVALLVAATIVFTQLRDVSLGRKRKTPSGPQMEVREAVAHPTYRSALVSGFANGWSSFGVRMALLPLFAVTVLGEGPEVAGIALAVFAIGTAAAMSFSGRLTDSLGRRPMVISGLIINGLSTAALGFTSSVSWFIVLSIVAGLGAGILNPAQQAAVADVIGPERGGGKVLATFQMSQDSGAILGPIIAGALVDLGYSFGWAFALTGATAILAAVAWISAKETLPPRT